MLSNQWEIKLFKSSAGRFAKTWRLGVDHAYRDDARSRSFARRGVRTPKSTSPCAKEKEARRQHRRCWVSPFTLTFSIFVDYERVSLPQIKERNFDTTARKVKKKRDVGDEEDTVEKQIAGLADMIIADDEAKRHEELVSIVLLHVNEMILTRWWVQDLLNIAPKRPNWDLKRDLDKKLVKLERQTQQAIHNLIRTYTLCQSNLRELSNL
jgi:hypothetical protein